MSLQEKLRRLFLLDQQVRGFQGRLDTATGRLAAQQAKLDQLNQQHDELHTQLKHTQAKASGLENQVNDVDQRIERLRQQMQMVKSNKEYSAVLIEVNTLKIDKSKLEDDALEQLNEVDRLNEASQEIQTQIGAQNKLVAGAESDVQACRADIGQELNELNAQRTEAENEVPNDTKVVFNRMADMHEGEAMATVIQESRRNMEYTCGGCYMSIPVERVNTLMTLQDQMVLCPNCSRILYLDQDLKASIGCK